MCSVLSFAALLVATQVVTPRYPKGGACKESQLEEYACRTLYDTNQFIFYLCLGWA